MDAAQLREWRARVENGELSQEALRTAGQELFGLLSCGALAEAWRQRGDARIVLDVRPRELRGLPWELLCDDDERELFCHERSSALRAQLPFTSTVGVLQVPVRLLIVVGTLEPGDRSWVEDEIDAIYAGLRTAHCSWEIDVAYRPRQQDLTAWYETVAPHVLHFVGHGTEVGEGEDRRSALQIMPADGRSWEVTGGWVRGALGHLPGPRLVVLNSCRTSAARPLRKLSEVTEGFLANGAAAVVSMRGDIATDAALEFSNVFYKQLAGGAPVDVATSRARRALRYHSGFEAGDWSRPTLTVQADPERVLQLERLVDLKDLPKGTENFEQVRWMVDRTQERRDLARLVDPKRDPKNDAARAAAPAVPGGLVFVRGGMQVGKSTIIRSYALTHRARGLPSVYVEFPQVGNLSWMGFVERVAGAAREWLGEKVTRTCRDFVAEMKALEDGTVPASGKPSLARPEHPGSPGMPQRYEPPQARIAAGFAMLAPDHATGPVGPSEAYFTARARRFIRFVRKLASGALLLLILDHVECLKGVRGLFERCVIAPAAERRLLPARLVVVDRSRELEDYAALRRADVPKLTVGPFEQAQMARLAREYCVRRWDRCGIPEGDRERWRSYVRYIQRQADLRMQEGNPGVDPQVFLLWEQSAKESSGWSPP